MLVYFLFAVGLFFLVKGASVFVKGAAALAKRLHMSNLMIGLTVLAMGTSLPEFIINVVSAAKGNTGIALGNIVGSNMANIMLILGITAMISVARLDGSSLWREIPFSFLSIIVIIILANDVILNKAQENVFTRGDGLILLSFFLLFVYYIFLLVRNARHDAVARDVHVKDYASYEIFGMLAIGMFALYVGGQWTVDGAVHIATMFGLSEFVISATIIAIGTSLPELVISIIAAARHDVSLAVGNIIGSNIFNAFFVLGATFVIHDVPFTPMLNYDLLFLLVATFLLFMFAFVDRKHQISRKNGLVFIGIYVLYIVYLLGFR
ncbi:MAG: calcium/sodium antiporter [Nanoarchaeota archaeon]